MRIVRVMLWIGLLVGPFSAVRVSRAAAVERPYRGVFHQRADGPPQRRDTPGRRSIFVRSPDRPAGPAAPLTITPRPLSVVFMLGGLIGVARYRPPAARRGKA